MHSPHIVKPDVHFPSTLQFPTQFIGEFLKKLANISKRFLVDCYLFRLSKCYFINLFILLKAATTSPEIQKQKIEGFLARWKDVRFPMFAAIFIDIVRPLRVLPIGLQAEDNDLVKALRRIKEFHWTMAKLQACSFGTANFDTFKEN